MADDDYENANQSRQEKKYGKDVENFKVRGTGTKINDDTGMNLDDRPCTDILMLILFIAMIASMGYFTAMGAKHGNVGKLMAPLDGNKHFCGYSEGFEGHKKLYLTSLKTTSITEIFNSGVCVSKCPTKGEQIDCVPTEGKVEDCNTQEILDHVYKTKSVADFCIPVQVPDDFKEGLKALLKSFSQTSVGSYFHDMYLSSRAMYGSLAMGAVYCLLYIYLMSIFAEYLAWVCVVLVQIGLGVTTFALYSYRKTQNENLQYTREDFVNNKDHYLGDEYEAAEDSIKSQERLVKWLLVGLIVVGLVTVSFLLCIVCGFRSLKLAIDVIDASADFIRDHKRTILVPVLYFFLIMLFLVFWLGAFGCVAAMNEIEADGLIPQAKNLKWTSQNKYIALYMLFCAFWFTSWLQYTSNFVIMVTASTFYFDCTESNGRNGYGDLSTGFKLAHVNHTGSVAFGALVIALVRTIRVVFMYMAEKATQASGENPVVKSVVRCANCCLWCIEKICDYINKLAFAYMAVSGEGFCTSAWNGFLLNLKHLAKFWFANVIASVFTFIGKIAIVAGNCYSLLMVMKHVTDDYEEVGSLLGPVGAIAISTYITADIFLGIFDTVVKALLVCLAIDQDMHDGEIKFGPETFDQKATKIKGANMKTHDEEN